MRLFTFEEKIHSTFKDFAMSGDNGTCLPATRLFKFLLFLDWHTDISTCLLCPDLITKRVGKSCFITNYSALIYGRPSAVWTSGSFSCLKEEINYYKSVSSQVCTIGENPRPSVLYLFTRDSAYLAQEYEAFI